MKLKKFICFIISIAMSFAGTNVIFGGNNSETDVLYETDGYSIYFDESTGTITAVYGGDTDLTIPSQINGVTVTTIGQQAFGGYYETLMGKITIPDTVTTIETGAFSHLTSGEIILSDSIETIGNRAFFDWHCTETNPTITIPSSVISIGSGVFSPDFSLSIDYDCGCAAIEVSPNNNHYSSLDGVLFNKDQSELITYPFAKSADSYEVPESVTTINDIAFAYSKLKSVTISKSVTTIGDSPFYYCTELESVYCYEGSAADDSSLYPDGVNIVYLEEEADYELIFDSATGTVTGYTGTPTNVTIPSEIDGVAVTAIGDKAFAECGYLESIVISSGVTSIGSNAFYLCMNLTDADIPDSVTSIGESAFLDCYSLKNVTLPNGITEISDMVFDSCTSLTSITIPDSVTYIGVGAFNYCQSLTSIDIPDNVISIGGEAFSHCMGLTNITIPNSVTSIGNYAFDYCDSLEYVYCYVGSAADDSSIYPDGVTIVYIDESETEIIASGICGDNLTWTLDNEGTLTISGSGDMYDYSQAYDLYYIYSENPWESYSASIKTVIIEDGVTRIGDFAFYYCTNLASITISESVTNIGYGAFQGNTGLKDITIPDSVTDIEEYVFYGCSNLASVTLSKNLTSIGNSAFRECISLTSISFPESITDIDFGAFYGCGLTSITIPSSITNISSYAFAYCTNLTSVTLPDSITSIDSYAFTNCSSLPTIKLPDSITNIGSSAFSECSTLDNIIIPNNVTEINSSTFYLCTDLTNITLSDSLVSIDMNAFDSCTGLTSITIPENVTSVSVYAFMSCSNLKEITILSKTLNTMAFNKYYGVGTEIVYLYKGSKADNVYLYDNNGNLYNSITMIYLDETTESTTETTTEAEAVASPAFTVVGVFGGRNVTFTSDTAGAVIYYSADSYILTTDDAMVSNGGTVLFEDFYGTIYARAYYDGVWSDVSRLILKIPVTAAPEITVNDSSVTIASGTPSSFVCYTTDGTEPVVDNEGTAVNGTWIRKNGARVNSGTITVDPGSTVKAIAVRSCFTNSVSASAYVPVGSPQFTVVGAYGGRNVTFNSSTEGAVIYYSADDYVLSTSDTKVSNGQTVLFEDFYGTIYARAYYNGVWSDVSRLILKIPVVEAPEVTYEGNVVRLVSGTKDSFICYTTDGTDPVVKPDGTVTNGTWIKVNGARTTKGSITVSSGTTVKAIAIRNCFTNSSISSCTVS